MDDHIARINSDPVRPLLTFDINALNSIEVEAMYQLIRKGADMSGGCSRGDDHVIGKAGLIIKFYTHYFFGFICVQRLLDKAF